MLRFHPLCALFIHVLVIAGTVCPVQARKLIGRVEFVNTWVKNYQTDPQKDWRAYDKKLALKLVQAAKKRSKQEVVYDPAYVALKYPGGDVPKDRGVCTDVIVRVYRSIGIDLQVKIHKDMGKNFKLYPAIYRQQKPDKNIDHRRVANMLVFFKRHGLSLSIKQKAEHYLPGDIVIWHLGNGFMHVGMVVDSFAPKSKHLMVIHNISEGPKQEDVLFRWEIIAHYRYPKPEGA